MRKQIIFISIISLVLVVAASAQTPSFTYQGNLNTGGTAANGPHDIRFELYTAASGGTLLNTETRPGVEVTNGRFTAVLNFPASNYDGSERYIAIGVRLGGTADPYTLLTPRQRITSAPYAVKSLNATTADNALQLGGVAANQYVTTTSGGTNFIRNSTTLQTPANINISGTASVGSHGDFGGVLSAGSFFVVGNSTLQGNLTVNGLITGNLPAGDSSYVQNRTSTQTGTNFNVSGTGTANIFAATQFNGGNFSGALYNGSVFNSTGGFFQNNVRILNTPGTNNTFAGRQSGSVNTGADNSFFGFNSGNDNTSGANNSFFGSDAGGVNNTGFDNSFFGSDTGDSNTSGAGNSFFGRSTGSANTTASENSFFGYLSGEFNSTGQQNSFYGARAGRANTTASENSFFGVAAGVANTTGADNSFFGAGAGQVNTAGLDNSYFGRGAGQASNGSQNTFIGKTAGGDNTSGSSNSFFGRAAGGGTTTGNFNTFVGKETGTTNTTGSNNTAIGAGANVANPSQSYATAIGAGAVVTGDNTIQIGRVGSIDRVIVSGRLYVRTLFSGGNQFLCYDTTFEILASCSSSLRYKNNVQTFTPGLDTVRRLRPISFNWKTSGAADVGFGAEEVAAVEPLLTTYNKTGEIEGVKYAQITTVLVNAVKEQQEQIEQLLQKDRQQQALIDALRKLVCQTNPQAEVCKEIQK